MANMICDSCGCGCLILPYQTLYKRQRRLHKLDIEDYPEILDAVNEIALVGDSNSEGLLGNECFTALCNDIKQAQEKANIYIESTPDATGEQASYLYYLSDAWKAVVQNRHFQMMYAAYAMYFYYWLGIAHAETSKDGDFIHNRAASQPNDGDGGQNIDFETSGGMAQKTLTLAKMYANRFKMHFWNKNKKNYDCKKWCNDGKVYLSSNCCDSRTHHNSCNCGLSTCKSCNGYPESPPPPRRPRPTAL